MREYGLTLLVAAAVTYLLTPLVRRLAIAVGALHAARDRDVHVEPTPLLGGIAMYGGLAAALLVADQMMPLSSVFAGTRVASGLLLAGGLLVTVGIVDDRWGMGAVSKLAAQVAAGVILVWSGTLVAWLPLPGSGTLSLDYNEQVALTILVVVVTINAVNFIDGLDGLAAGVVGIGAAAFFLFYYTLTKRLGLGDLTGPALSSAVLAGVCIGFLPHNFYPARVFMGDTGAMLLGLLLAYAPISSLSSLDPNSLTNTAAHGGGVPNRFPEVLPLLLPAVIMLIPYTDLVLAVIRRMRAGQSPFAADKKHLHHRLLDTGHSQRASVMLMYLWATLFSGTVVLLSVMRTRLLILAAVTVVAVLVLLLASVPRLRPWTRRGRSRAPAPAVSRPQPAAVPGRAASGYPAQDYAVPDYPGRDNAARDYAGQDYAGQDYAGQDYAVPDYPANGHLPNGRPMPDRPVPDTAVPDRPVRDQAAQPPSAFSAFSLGLGLGRDGSRGTGAASHFPVGRPGARHGSGRAGVAAPLTVVVGRAVRHGRRFRPGPTIWAPTSRPPRPGRQRPGCHECAATNGRCFAGLRCRGAVRSRGDLVKQASRSL